MLINYLIKYQIKVMEEYHFKIKIKFRNNYKQIIDWVLVKFLKKKIDLIDIKSLHKLLLKILNK